MTRSYRLGRRQPAVDGTARAILSAARQLVQDRPSAEVSVAEIARRAGVSRITVYNRFGSRRAVLSALAAPATQVAPPDGDAREALRRYLAASCERWAVDTALARNLPTPPEDGRART